MGQARTRGTHFDRVRQAYEREQALQREEQDRERGERAKKTLLDIAEGQHAGLGGPYKDKAALAMAASHHGLRVAMVQ